MNADGARTIDAARLTRTNQSAGVVQQRHAGRRPIRVHLRASAVPNFLSTFRTRVPGDLLPPDRAQGSLATCFRRTAHKGAWRPAPAAPRTRGPGPLRLPHRAQGATRQTAPRPQAPRGAPQNTLAECRPAHANPSGPILPGRAL